MNDEFCIPNGTYEEQVEYINQWNEQHPDDCHSPWMGALDGKIQVIPEENTEEVIETPEPVQKAPKTGEFCTTLYISMIVLGLLMMGLGFKTRR